MDFVAACYLHLACGIDHKQNKKHNSICKNSLQFISMIVLELTSRALELKSNHNSNFLFNFVFDSDYVVSVHLLLFLS